MAVADGIPDRLRAQLVALGIPPAKHDREGLIGVFPREFNVAASGLNAEDLARVLIHLAGRGLITITPSRPTLKPVTPGWHFCHFYRDDHELLEFAAPYIAEGLRNGEGCFWVMPLSVSSSDAYAALARSGANVDACLARGQLEVVPHPRWYLNDSGELKSFEQITEALLQKQERALDRGFTFLRAAGDAGWVSGTEESRSFIDYEMKISAAIGATKIAAACSYRATVTASELVAIVTAHQDAVSSPVA